MQDSGNPILVTGGGPAGLVLAIELGRRGIPCVLFEEDANPPAFPKANNSTARTMEHYRRLGLADEVRMLGLPEDHPGDVSYHTRFERDDIARLQWPARREVLANRYKPDARWPTPEPLHRGQQMFIEPLLQRHAAQLPAVTLRFGWRVESVSQDEAGVTVQARETATGRVSEFRGRYAVGCDGPRSMTRQTIGVSYQGHGAEDREFMGGRMLASYIRAPAFYEFASGGRRSWQYWGINAERKGVAIAIDRDHFVLHTQLPPGVSGSRAYARETLEKVSGRSFPYEIVAAEEWTAGYTLVAEQYRRNRIFLAGDAAHLFTPTAGQGYNTSVDDVANLAWKLAAVCHGWGGPELLDSYQAERKPIGERNTRFARFIAEHFRSLSLPAWLEEETAQGAAARAELGAQMQEIARLEFDIPGITFGMFYADSPLIASEAGGPPADDPHLYLPTAVPGARAPHVWLDGGDALYDRFGREFTLLKLGGTGDVRPLMAAAAARGAPLTLLELNHPEARDLYAADLVMIRPDQHVAWRGDKAPAEPAALIARVLGFPAH